MVDVRFDYSGTRVLVTGGTAGIGNGVAQTYRDAGAQVVITGTRGSASDYDEDLSGFEYLQLDMESAESIDAVARALPALDVLINNAGQPMLSLGLDEYEPDVFARAVNMLLTGAYRMAAQCGEALKRSAIPGGASVIGLASLSSFEAYGLLPGYGAAKSGLLGMTRALALRWGSHGVRVNAVAPGVTRSRSSADFANNAEAIGPTIARTPLGRIGDPEDVAGAILFLTSPAASWITGQTLVIDGGFSIVGDRMGV